MDESDFEGTLVLEKLAAVGKVDEFFDAVDSDNMGQAVRLMKSAGVAVEEIEVVVRMMGEGVG